MAKKIKDGKPFKGPAASPPKPQVSIPLTGGIIPDGPLPHERKPKATIKVHLDSKGSLCDKDDPCGNCIHGDSAADYCEVSYLRTKAEVIAAHPGLEIIKVHTRKVQVQGQPFHKAKPYIQDDHAPAVVLRRTFILA